MTSCQDGLCWLGTLYEIFNAAKQWTIYEILSIFFIKQEESARERALCQLTECFWFVKVIRGQNNYQEKGCTEIQ